MRLKSKILCVKRLLSLQAVWHLNDLRVKNLRLLVKRPEARSTVNIEDLRQVIITSDHMQDTALRAEINVAPWQTENALVY